MAKKRMFPMQRRSYLFLVLSTLVVLIGGSLTLFWQVEQQHSSKADGSYVVGPPSLPAATVDTILARMGSPMTGTGKVVEQAARQTNIDDAFALAVWWAETNDGAAGVGRADRNPGSVRGSVGYPAAFDGYTIYPSYAAGIIDWFNVVKGRYINRGLTSVYTICYPYVGTSGAANWANKVVNLMFRYRGEAPPPTPVPTPKPTPTPRSHFLVQAEPKLAGTPHSQSQTKSKTPTLTTPQPQAASLAQGSQTVMIVLGLLAALMIALWGMRKRREIVVPIAPIVAWQPTAPNKFTLDSFAPFPLEASALVPEAVALRPDPVTPYPAFAARDFLPLASEVQLPFSQPDRLQPVSAVPLAPYNANAGLLASYRNGETVPRRVKLLRGDAGGQGGRDGQDVSISYEISGVGEEREATTGALPEPMPVSVPRPFALAGASRSGGGLLRRYAEVRE